MDGMDVTSRRYLTHNSIRNTIPSCKSHTPLPLTVPNHNRTPTQTDRQTDPTCSSHEGEVGKILQGAIGRRAGRWTRRQEVLQRRSESPETRLECSRIGPEGFHVKGMARWMSFGERSRYSATDPDEASDQDRCDPEPTGSAERGGETMGGGVDRPDETVTRTSRRRIQGGIDGRPRCDPEPSGSAERGRGRRGYGAERPGKTSRAGCRVNMIRSYGRSVATNLNEPRFGESRAAPLQGADIGRPSRSELEESPERWHPPHGSLHDEIRQVWKRLPAAGTRRRPSVATVQCIDIVIFYCSPAKKNRSDLFWLATPL